MLGLKQDKHLEVHYTQPNHRGCIDDGYWNGTVYEACRNEATTSCIVTIIQSEY